MRSLCKEDGHIISILETPAPFLAPELGTSCHHSQLPLLSTHQIQLMEKGIWNSLVGKSDYMGPCPLFPALLETAVDTGPPTGEFSDKPSVKVDIDINTQCEFVENSFLSSKQNGLRPSEWAFRRYS